MDYTFISIAPPAAIIQLSPLKSQPLVQDDWEQIKDYSTQCSALIVTHSTPLFLTLFLEKGVQWADEVINTKDKSTLMREAKEVE